MYIYIHLIIYEHSMCLYMKESYESYEAKSRLRFIFATLEVRRGSGALPPKLADRSQKIGEVTTLMVFDCLMHPLW